MSVTQINIAIGKKTYLCAFFRQHRCNTSSWSTDSPGKLIFSIRFRNSHYVVLQKEKDRSFPFSSLSVRSCVLSLSDFKFKAKHFLCSLPPPQYTQTFSVQPHNTYKHFLCSPTIHTNIFCAAPQIHTNFHFHFVAHYSLFTAPTRFGHRIWTA
jgi:hypothetical protein